MALLGLLSKDTFVSLLSLLEKENLILLLQTLALIFWILLLSQGIYNRYFHPLKDIPGPFWGSINSLWLYYSIHRAKYENYHLPIHKKYGSMVRMAPNHVEISDPNAIETIYGPKHDFPKATFYKSFDSGISHTPDSFCCLDSETHDRRRRAVAAFYAQAAVLEYEPCIDRCINLFHQRMEGLANTEEATDMALWLRKYTFDIIGELFYGREGGFGFLRDNIDYNDWGKLMETLVRPITAAGYAPYGFKSLNILIQLLYPDSRAGVFGFFKVIKQAREALRQRLDDIASGRLAKSNDMLNKLINLAQNDDQKYSFTLLDVTTEIYAVIFAGADTTSTALTAIFYYSHKDPKIVAKLKREIDEAFEQGKLVYPIRFADANRLPYLRAVVNEAMRIHPSTGMSLPRVVPGGGVEICSKYFPAGTVVAMNAAVVQLDKNIYGEDSEQFIPERWTRDGERAAANMERHFLQFGYGKRMCLGKHISYTEMFKLIPTLLHKYDFELTGKKEWTVSREWFQHQKDVHVKITKRDHVSAEKSRHEQ